MRSLMMVPTRVGQERATGLIPALLAQHADLDVLVVTADGDADIPALEALRMSAPRRVHLLHHSAAKARGIAYLAGLNYALACDYPCLLELDPRSDNMASGTSWLFKLSGTQQANYALGARRVHGGSTTHWLHYRQRMSRHDLSYGHSVLTIPSEDLTAGFRCFHRRILAALHLNPFDTQPSDIQIELTYHTSQAGFTRRTFPIVFTERLHGANLLTGRIIDETISIVWRLRLLQLTPRIAKGLTA